MIRRVAIAVALLAPAALAEARIVQVRSVEAQVSRSDRDFCSTAPFKANAIIAGTLYSHESRASDGRVVQDGARAVGSATACVQLTNFLFPEGLAQNFFLRLALQDGLYTARGTCTIVSNDVPVHGLVLAGCNLKLIAFPDGVVGGAVTSLSTFDPFRLSGFATGSYWTAQIYDRDAAAGGEKDPAQAMEFIEGGDDDTAK